MNIKKIYVNPGDMLEICVVFDADLRPCKEEFQAQTTRLQQPMQLTIKDNVTVAFSDPAYKFALESFNGVIKRWLE